ncbi:MAG: hypothetical protein NC390_06810 [Fusobacterium sp.]|nr:hypothetical protein [Fusobacterium sp.]
MKTFVHNFILSIILGLFLMQSQGFCIELDNSIDAEINKKYNASSLEDTLPKLPEGLEPNEPVNTGSSVSTKTIKPTEARKPIPIQPVDRSTATKIGRGTKFRAISKNWASDSAKIGNRVSFTTTKPVTKRYITIPAGSTLRGRIVDAHLPQYTGNGGLVKLEIESITLDGATHYADGKITKANGKKIFLNNIKGKRTYLANTGKNIKKSHQFFQKSMKKTASFASDGATVILSPFTFLGGTVGYLGGVLLSPVIALKAKGNRISLPPETLYEIKLTQDLYIYD